MKISEKQIISLFRIVSHTYNDSQTIGDFTYTDRQELINDIVEQQNDEVVDTRDFELMKLASEDI